MVYKWLLGAALGCSLVGPICPVLAQEPQSPLERLKSRNAEARWTELKESMQQPRRRPGQAAPRSNAAPAPPPPRTATVANPEWVAPPQKVRPALAAPAAEPQASLAPVSQPVSLFEDTEAWRAAENSAQTFPLPAPVPATLGRIAELQPAPDPLSGQQPNLQSPATLTVSVPEVPLDGADVVLSQENIVSPAQTTEPTVNETETHSGKLNTGTARPFPNAATTVPDASRVSAAVVEVTVPTPDAIAGRAAAGIPMPPALPAVQLRPEEVFSPTGDGAPLLVPNPQAFNVAATPPTVEPRHLPELPATVTPNPAEFLPPMPETEATPLRTALADLPPAPEGTTETAVEVEATAVEMLFRPISRIEPFHDYSPSGVKPTSAANDPRNRTPKILPLPASGSVERAFATTEFQWEAANVFHNPLYFEDTELERYGHTYPFGLQPVASLAKFGVQTAALPYQIALNPVWRQQYPLGYYRPGDPAPPLFYQMPFDSKAAVTAAGVYTGLFFVFP